MLHNCCQEKRLNDNILESLKQEAAKYDAIVLEYMSLFQELTLSANKEIELLQIIKNFKKN